MKVRWHWTYLVLFLIMTQTSVTENTGASLNGVNSSLESTKEQLDVRESPVAQTTLEEIVDKIEGVSNVTSNYQKKVRKTKTFVPKSVKEVDNDEEVKPRKKKKTKKLKNDAEKSRSRQKRMIWITDDGRLALPPGTVLMITPSLGLPFVRYPPDGFLANISVSLPVTIEFDKLGLTDNANPLGVLPPVLARSMGKAAGSLLANYIGKYIRSRRQKRSNEHFHENFKFTKTRIDDNSHFEDIPQLPDEHKHAFHGGERALLYAAMEDFIANFGVDGKACILRTICEVHSKSIHHFGLVGEMVKLFLTASLSPFSDLLNEYVLAEKIGRGIQAPGECFPYYKDCPRSIFKTNDMHQKYEKEHQNLEKENAVTNDVGGEFVDSALENEIYDANSSNQSM